METFFCDNCGKPFQVKVTGIFCTECARKRRGNTTKEKLIKLLKGICLLSTYEEIAEYLIDNGVTIET